MATQNTDSVLEHSGKPSRSTHRRSRSSRSSTRKVAVLRVALAAMVAVTFLLGLVGLVYLQRLSNENDRLFFDVRKQEKELTEANVLIKELMAERESLVQGRIPGLQEIAYDETFELGDTYVRNIIFTLTRTNGKNKFEYKAVLENQTTDVITPKVYIRLYDELGTQVGTAYIGGDEQSIPFNLSDSGEEVLKPEEIRSYSDDLNVVDGAQPKYFAVAAH